MANSRMAGYLRAGSLVQLVFMIVVGLILYSALTEHWDTLRRVSLFLKNGFFGTPEPQTSVVLYLICILVLSWLAVIKRFPFLVFVSFLEGGNNSGSGDGSGDKLHFHDCCPLLRPLRSYMGWNSGRTSWRRLHLCRDS